MSYAFLSSSDRVPAIAPRAEVSGTGVPINYNVKFGYSGAFTRRLALSIPATVNADTIADDPTDGPCSLYVTEREGVPGGRYGGNDVHPLPAVRRGRQPRHRPRHVRVQCCELSSIGLSGGPTSAEVINFSAGNGTFAAQNFTVVVQGFVRCRLVAVQASHVAARHRQRLGT